MNKFFVSNSLLTLGVIALVGFCVLEVSGLNSDPLLPAFSAFFIGCTAVLDRVGSRSLE